MEPRKVQKHGRSLAVVLPADLCHTFGIEKGQVVGLMELQGYGILIVRHAFEGKVPLPEARLRTMKDFADQVVADCRRKCKQIGFTFVNNMFHRMFGAALREEIIRLNVPRAAKKYEELQLKEDLAAPERARLDRIEKDHREALRVMGYVYDPRRARSKRAARKKKGDSGKEATI